MPCIMDRLEVNKRYQVWNICQYNIISVQAAKGAMLQIVRGQVLRR